MWRVQTKGLASKDIQGSRDGHMYSASSSSRAIMSIISRALKLPGLGINQPYTPEPACSTTRLQFFLVFFDSKFNHLDFRTLVPVAPLPRGGGPSHVPNATVKARRPPSLP